MAILALVGVSFIFWGVAPRTLGRQRADNIMLRMAGLLAGLNTVLGPIPQLMILLGNALTPGRGFADGPFSSEAELREMVDIAALNSKIKFDRTDVPFTEREILGDATETGLARFAGRWVPEGDYDRHVKSHRKVFEVPFNSTNKWALVIVSLFFQACFW